MSQKNVDLRKIPKPLVIDRGVLIELKKLLPERIRIETARVFFNPIRNRGTLRALAVSYGTSLKSS